MDNHRPAKIPRAKLRRLARDVARVKRDRPRAVADADSWRLTAINNWLAGVDAVVGLLPDDVQTEYRGWVEKELIDG